MRSSGGPLGRAGKGNRSSQPFSPRGRRIYFFFHWLSAGLGLALVPILILGLLGVVHHALWFVAIEAVLEGVLLLIRPRVLRGFDTYRPPRGQRVP